MTPAESLIAKLYSRVAIATEFGVEAEGSADWPLLSRDEMILLGSVLQEASIDEID
jgi:hypothetical protein